MEFKRWMFSHFIRNFNTSPEPSTTNFKIRFLTINTMNSKSIFSETLFSSLNKTFHSITSLKELFTFSFSFLIKDFPINISNFIYLTKLNIHFHQGFTRTNQIRPSWIRHPLQLGIIFSNHQY